MPVIDPTNPITTETSCEYWNNELINLRILLNKVDAGILHLMTTGIKSYTLDTGQSSQKKESLDMIGLHAMRKQLMSNIQDLENKLGVGCKPAVIQVRPNW
jgi:hypothetical protein